MKRKRERIHAIFITFTVDNSKKGGRCPMVMLRMPNHYITQRTFDKILRTVARHYGMGLQIIRHGVIQSTILGIGGSTDDPSSYEDHDSYKKIYTESFPFYNDVFDNVRTDTFKAFELWDWDYNLNNVKLIREKIQVILENELTGVKNT